MTVCAARVAAAAAFCAATSARRSSSLRSSEGRKSTWGRDDQAQAAARTTNVRAAAALARRDIRPARHTRQAHLSVREQRGVGHELLREAPGRQLGDDGLGALLGRRLLAPGADGARVRRLLPHVALQRHCTGHVRRKRLERAFSLPRTRPSPKHPPERAGSTHACCPRARRPPRQTTPRAPPAWRAGPAPACRAPCSAHGTHTSLAAGCRACPPTHTPHCTRPAPADTTTPAGRCLTCSSGPCRAGGPAAS